ncbi:hypothetical protein BVRB_5g116340 [Beta vulgaris subsp. vulgaris]|nr:hypothetical protein BVRB_5g116340 [Beta vulgaris subsp. vulgaris]
MEGESSKHVMVLTYPAQGHINPLIQFTKLLASKGVKATLATTHYTATAIQATSNGITIESISDGFDKVDVAKEMGVCKAAFMTNSASVCSLYWYFHNSLLSLPLTPDRFPLVLPGLPELRLYDLPSFIAYPFEFSEYLGAIMDQFSTLEENDWVFINTFAQLESQIEKAMSGKWPLVMVGPMLPSAYLNQPTEDRDYGGSLWNQATENCLRWLDTKPSNSVIYISFGSMAELPGKQVEELARGLRNMEIPFLWVVKDTAKLPPEFISSLNDGIGIVMPWCNQLEVLAHQATGCFITHCGWNSILEGISLGVPMVGIPQWSDQPLNAKMMEDIWKVGVRMKKGSEGIVSREEIERCVREVMVGLSNEEMKMNSNSWRKEAVSVVSKGGSSEMNISKFLETLQRK